MKEERDDDDGASEKRRVRRNCLLFALDVPAEIGLLGLLRA